MALSTPYPGVQRPYKGNITETQDDLNAWIERVHRAGIQVNCHANGDVAIDMVLTAVERAQRLFPRADARPKITHCTLINDDLLRRIKTAGVVPAPFTSYAYYNTDKFHFYGEELMKRSMAYRSFLDAGIPAAAGSDFSPGPFAPLMGIQGMVTRTGWNGETWGANQRISVEEALRINTINGAFNSHEEAIKGSITPGKMADFVVLAGDPHTVDKEKIKDIAIVVRLPAVPPSIRRNLAFWGPDVGHYRKAQSLRTRPNACRSSKSPRERKELFTSISSPRVSAPGRESSASNP